MHQSVGKGGLCSGEIALPMSAHNSPFPQVKDVVNMTHEKDPIMPNSTKRKRRNPGYHLVK